MSASAQAKSNPEQSALAPALGVAKSFGGRSWVMRADSEAEGLALARAHNIPEVMGRLLAARGVGPGEVDNFLAPSLRALLPDPSSFADMDRASERLADAVEREETIAVFGDYDVDGASSAALLVRFFRALGRDLLVHIPDRMAEGYGPTPEAMRSLKARGADIVITVDCGTAAHEALEAARDAGLEVIVADHHLVTGDLPHAAAVVNPNRPDCSSGQGMLAAAGVTFMLVVGVNRMLRARGIYGPNRPEPDLRRWLDLVALGTLCDVVPLQGVNRAFAAQGLKIMERWDNPGLAALAKVAGLGANPKGDSVGFFLGPRINAGGRVGDARLGVELLSTDCPEKAGEIAQGLDAYNKERQAIDRKVLAEARAQVEAEIEVTGLPSVLVVAGEGWHPGVVGIVAGRLAERFGRPAIVIALGDGPGGPIGRGSGRSVPGVDLGNAVSAAVGEGILVKGGGHEMAAGLTIRPEAIAELKVYLEARLSGALAKAREARLLRLDGILGLGGATARLAELLEAAAPFGAGNPEPVFAFAGIRAVRADIVGTNHVRCAFQDLGGTRLDAIAFRAGEDPLGKALLAGDDRPLHIAGKIRIDEWQGRRRVKLHVLDGAPGSPPGACIGEAKSL